LTQITTVKLESYVFITDNDMQTIDNCLTRNTETQH